MKFRNPNAKAKQGGDNEASNLPGNIQADWEFHVPKKQTCFRCAIPE